MKLAVMGAGAIGGYVGARLAAAGADVTFIARGRHLGAMRQAGLLVRSPLGDVRVDARTATDDPAAVGEVDVVLLATKLYDVESAAAAILPLVGAGTAVVCLQNGVDATEIAARRYGRGRVAGGVVLINAEITAPGIIRHNALNRLTVGELERAPSARIERVAALARRAGIETLVSPDIRLEIWRKFLLLAPMSALSALTRVELARIRRQPETWQLAEQGMHEVVAVANAEGVGLTEEDVRATMTFVQGMPPTWKASLAVDLEHGHRLEVDWLAGAVCRLGHAAGIPTPFHQIALAVLKPHAQGSGA